jgi:hypothetical protein
MMSQIRRIDTLINFMAALQVFGLCAPPGSFHKTTNPADELAQSY